MFNSCIMLIIVGCAIVVTLCQMQHPLILLIEPFHVPFAPTHA